jgi:uncharacterized Fe-S cluster-containing radical SAM superfamily protein
MKASYLNSVEMANRYRSKALDVPGRRILVTQFSGTEQEDDLSVPANCNGYGRIRHFQRSRVAEWPDNPLPIDPARHYLQLVPADAIEAQVFQNAVCNWRCWYCFVPFRLLDANTKHSSLMGVSELIDLWEKEPQPPAMIDLSGGQPDIVPEWIVWTINEIRSRGLDRKVYLWSDDNLSTDYFWTALTDAEREFIRGYAGYGRVCCFKGFDDESFSFNTSAAPNEFSLQFDRIARLINLGIDIYGYATFTCPNVANLGSKMSVFIDRLRAISDYLPLRVVPLQIWPYTPTSGRFNILRSQSLENQRAAVLEWSEKLERLYPSSWLERAIYEIPLREVV